MGGKFVLPFRFRNADGARERRITCSSCRSTFAATRSCGTSCTTHSHKDVKASQSFEYNPADARWPSLFDLLRPLDDLEDMLLTDCAGKTFGIKRTV